MAIAPISSIGHKGYTKNIQFEARNRENNGSNVVRNTAMAVPLTVLLAMSPLNPVDARISDRFDGEGVRIEQLDEISQNKAGTVINSKKVYQGEHTSSTGTVYDLYQSVKLMSKDGNARDFEAVKIETTFSNASKIEEHYVREAITCNYSILSDDNSCGNKFSLHKLLASKEGQPYKNNFKYGATRDVTDVRLTSFVVNELDQSSNNTNIKRTINNSKLYLSANSLELSNKPNKKSLKNAVSVDFSSRNHMGAQDFQGDNGKYTFNYYESKFDKGKIGIVTLKKDGGAELTVLGNYPSKAIFNDKDEEKSVISYGATVLEDKNGDKYVLSDMLLTNALTLIYNDAQTSALAYPCKEVVNSYLSSDNGFVHIKAQ